MKVAMVEVKCKLKDIEKAARFCFLLPVYLQSPQDPLN